MDTRKVTAEYRLAKWAEIIKTRQEKGQSIQEYCEAEGISRNAYFYWQRKLRETACTELARCKSAAGAGLIPNGWTQIEALAPGHEEITIAIEAGGCRVNVKAGVDPNLLTTVLRALKNL